MGVLEAIFIEHLEVDTDWSANIDNSVEMLFEDDKNFVLWTLRSKKLTWRQKFR